MPNLILACEYVKQEFVQMLRRDTLQFVPAFDDNVVAATAVDFDVRAREILSTPAIDFIFNFGEGCGLH
jgi:hypothetical protein